MPEPAPFTLVVTTHLPSLFSARSHVGNVSACVGPGNRGRVQWVHVGFHLLKPDGKIQLLPVAIDSHSNQEGEKEHIQWVHVVAM